MPSGIPSMYDSISHFSLIGTQGKFHGLVQSEASEIFGNACHYMYIKRAKTRWDE